MCNEIVSNIVLKAFVNWPKCIPIFRRVSENPLNPLNIEITICVQCRVMAFLRSVSRCNQSLAVSRKFSSSIRSGVQRRGHAASLTNFSRTELLACQKYYFDLQRELNTVNNGERKSMSTMAAAKSSSTTSPAASASSTDPPQRDPLNTSFNDPIAAFKSKTTWELFRAYCVYFMCSSEYLVENNMKVKDTHDHCFVTDIVALLQMKNKMPNR